MKQQKTEEQKYSEMYAKLQRARRRVRKLKAENSRLKSKDRPISPITRDMVKNQEQAVPNRTTISPFTKAILIRTANELEDLLKKIA